MPAQGLAANLKPPVAEGKEGRIAYYQYAKRLFGTWRYFNWS